jgi:DNA polymerase I-like protein with 3'-5' exonuclease and polymerase domains
MAIAVDFESFYDKELSIKVMGVDAYVAHPDVDFYMVSIVGEGTRYSGPVEEAPWKDVSGKEFVAHNARFDETVFQEAQRIGQIPASITYADWHCTADLAVYLGAPRSLKMSCEVLLEREVSKEYRVVALGKHGKDFSEEDWKIVVEAGYSDADSCLDLWDSFNHLWPEHEQTIAKSNRRMTQLGCNIDEEQLDKAIRSLNTELWKLEKAIPWDWSDNKTPLSTTKIRMECRKVEIPSPSSFSATSEECEEWEDLYAETYPWIKAIRGWRKTHGMIGKLNRIQSRLRKDPASESTSNFPYSIKYFGAHTGRFSGDDGFNMQNIYSKEQFGHNVRHMFVPRAGKKFLICDYAQIEARLLLWFVNDQAALAEIRKGTSVYEVHGRQTMGYTDPEPMKATNAAMYKLAKARVLGLGYGCGWETFMTVAKNMTGLIIEPDEAKEIVSAYRRDNRPITNFWYKLDGLLRASLNSPDRKLSLGLPSGRSMNYYNVAALDRGITVQAGLAAHRVHTWGGKLTENIVQATGREVLVDGWLKILEAFPDPEELRLLFHVHDEFVFEVDESIDTSKVERILCTPPDWGKTIPLGIDAELVDHYKK